MQTEIESSLLAKLGESLETSGDEVRFCCPFKERHERMGRPPDTKFHFYYNREKEKFHCWVCGAKGDKTYLAKLLKATVAESVEGALEMSQLLARLDDLEDVRPAVLSEYEEIPLPNGWVPITPAHLAWQYLKKRGIEESQIRDYHLGLSLVDLYRRIYFPGYDQRGKLVFYVSRCYVLDEEPKYNNPKIEGLRRRFIWNLQRILQEKHSFLSVCEGTISAMVSGRQGVATLGKTVTREQEFLLSIAPVERIYVELDADAFVESYRLWTNLGRRRPGVYLVQFDSGEDDPASVGRAAMEQKRERAILYSDEAALTVKLGRIS